MNTQVIGRAIAYMLNELIVKYDYDPSQLHCVGHSLGGHVCAYAGKYAYSNWGWIMGRITGLDPAGPQFDKTATEVRLYRTDAHFVDILHTDAGNENRGFIGSELAAGHADFYPDGGFQVKIVPLFKCL